MKRVLTVIESESPDDRTLIFNIGTAPEEPDILSEQGYIRTEVAGDGPASYLKQIGLYATNEEAQRAAEQYAAGRGVTIVKWELSRRQSGRGSEPSLQAGARPANDT
jgi:hypothetical protein